MTQPPPAGRLQRHRRTTQPALVRADSSPCFSGRRPLSPGAAPRRPVSQLTTDRAPPPDHCCKLRPAGGCRAAVCACSPRRAGGARSGRSGSCSQWVLECLPRPGVSGRQGRTCGSVDRGWRDGPVPRYRLAARDRLSIPRRPGRCCDGRSRFISAQVPLIWHRRRPRSCDRVIFPAGRAVMG